MLPPFIPQSVNEVGKKERLKITCCEKIDVSNSRRVSSGRNLLSGRAFHESMKMLKKRMKDANE